METSASLVFGVTVLFPFTPPSSANTDSFEMCLNRVIAENGTPSSPLQANIPCLTHT
jgi:hypothetical protein